MNVPPVPSCKKMVRSGGWSVTVAVSLTGSERAACSGERSRMDRAVVSGASEGTCARAVSGSVRNARAISGPSTHLVMTRLGNTFRDDGLRSHHEVENRDDADERGGGGGRLDVCVPENEST